MPVGKRCGSVNTGATPFPSAMIRPETTSRAKRLAGGDGEANMARLAANDDGPRQQAPRHPAVDGERVKHPSEHLGLDLPQLSERISIFGL